MTQTEPKFWSKTSWIQIGYGFWVNQILICVGLIFGFSAVAIPQLNEELNLTLAEQALIVSVMLLSPPIGCVLCGISVDRLGRRLTLIVCVIPFAVGWALLSFARKPLEIIIGRIISGIGVGMSAPTVFTFIAEISLPNIRGFLGVMPTLSVSLGITAQATFGALLNWKTLCYIGTGYSIALMIINLCLPESPYYVLIKGNLDDTKKTLKKFRAKDYDVEGEMESLRQYKEKHNLRKSDTKEYIRALFTPGSYIPFTIITIYFAFAQFSGVTVQTLYAVDFLKEANSSLDPFMGNILIGITRIASGLTLSIFIFKLRRRPIAIFSAVVLAAICLLLGIYLLLFKKPSVFPVIALVLYCFSATFGYISLPAMIVFEIIPLEIRGLLGGISLSVLNLLMFTANICFPYARVYLGFPQTLIGFGIVALTGAIYLYFFLPETKGVSLQEIEERYRIKKT